ESRLISIQVLSVPHSCGVTRPIDDAPHPGAILVAVNDRPDGGPRSVLGFSLKERPFAYVVLSPGERLALGVPRREAGCPCLRPLRSPTAQSILVPIDEDSFDALQLPWPSPRALHGKLLDVISGGRPLAIGVDLLFPEPSARGPNDDAALGAAVARAKNVVLA